MTRSLRSPPTDHRVGEKDVDCNFRKSILNLVIISLLYQKSDPFVQLVLTGAGGDTDRKNQPIFRSGIRLWGRSYTIILHPSKIRLLGFVHTPTIYPSYAALVKWLPSLINSKTKKDSELIFPTEITCGTRIVSVSSICLSATASA